jgi:hypothetical protein
MNEIIQNILAFTTGIAAVVFLMRKFFWKPKKTSSKTSCGTEDCGCH